MSSTSAQARLTPQLVGRIRRDLGWSRAQLGAYADVSETLVLKWEAGESLPTEERAALILALGEAWTRLLERLSPLRDRCLETPLRSSVRAPEPEPVE